MTLSATPDAMPTVQDLLDRDPGPPAPAPFREVSRRSFGLDGVPVERYTSVEFLRLEYERLWSKMWQFACREEEINAVGDYVVYEIGDRSVIITRSGPDRIQGFHNACLHRGTQLKQGRGNCEAFRCQYHGWTWNLDGSLDRIPCAWDFPQIDRDRCGLPEVRLERWGGFVFINFDDGASPLSQSLDILPKQVEGWVSFENAFTALHVVKIVPTNWKSAIEAFLESYHVAMTHPQGLEWSGDVNTQYDVWETVSRLITLLGVPSPLLGAGYDPEATYESAAKFFFGRDFDVPRLPHGASPREALATLLVQRYQAMGIDLTSRSVADVLDSLQYFVFPNWFPWASAAVPVQYRFRPNGWDPDSSIFDLYWLFPLPPGAERPPAAPARFLGPDEPFSAVSEMLEFGSVLDQDVSNMAAVQRGMKTTVKEHVTLSSYQESRIRHFHQLLDQWLSP